MTYKEVLIKYDSRIFAIGNEKQHLDVQISSTEHVLSEISKQASLPSSRPQGKRLEDVLRDQRECLSRLQGLKQERAALMLGGTSQVTVDEINDVQKLMGL